MPALTARDPRARGSLGAGLVLDVGVLAEAEWSPTARSAVRVASASTGRLGITEEVARRLVARRRGRLTVRLAHDLPIGQGFGSSAAGALATALAASRVLGLPRVRAIQTAHLADLYGRGGLGGVAAILGGGLEVRRRPGIPPFGRVARRPVSGTIAVATVGAPIPSPTVLADPHRLRRFALGARLLDRLGERPDLEAFWEASERFTDGARLASPRLRSAVRALRRRGARAAQAMFGGALFASFPSEKIRSSVLRWARGEDLRFREIMIGRNGARLLPD